MSKRIVFDGLNNTRDLSGMSTVDGRIIRDGKLIRSGNLHFASPRDLEKLSNTVSLIVDFRTQGEREENPDPVVAGVAALHLPIFERITAGISREKASEEIALHKLARDPQKARQYMIDTYTGFITNSFGVSQYSRFVRLLLKQREKAVLWHCTAGKDRAGFASVLVQSLLGVAPSDIMSDYLETNEYLKEDINRLVEMVIGKMDARDEQSETAIKYLFGAHEEYLEAVWRTIAERYGTFENFMVNALKISKAEQEQMKRIYLE